MKEGKEDSINKSKDNNFNIKKILNKKSKKKERNVILMILQMMNQIKEQVKLKKD